MATMTCQPPPLPPRPTRKDPVLGDAVQAFQRGISSRYAEWPALSAPQRHDNGIYIEDFIQLLHAFYNSETVNETRVYKIWALIAGSHQTKLLSTGLLLVLHLYKAMRKGQLLPPKVPIEIRTILQPKPSSQVYSTLTTSNYDVASRAAIFSVLVLGLPYESRAQLLLDFLEHSLVAEGPITAFRYLRSLLPYGVLTSIVRNAEDDMLANLFSAYVDYWPAVNHVNGEEAMRKLELLAILINLLWDAPSGEDNTEPILSRLHDIFEASLRKIQKEKRPLLLWMTLAVLPQ